MARIKLNNSLTINDAIENFLFYKMTQGVTEQTIDYYKSSFQKIFKHLNTNENLSALTQKDLQSVIRSISL